MTYQDDTLLSSNVSITKYLEMEKAEDEGKEGIIKFLLERFTECYITPLRGDPTTEHGFCTMAICCLMFETYKQLVVAGADENSLPVEDIQYLKQLSYKPDPKKQVN